MVHLEWITHDIGLIRVFGQGKRYGQRYEALAVVIEYPDYYEIKGFCGHLSMPRRFKEAMKSMFDDKPVKAYRHRKTKEYKEQVYD